MENVSNEIKKVSLKNERLDVTLEQEFKGLDENGNDIETIDDVTRKCSQIVHKDLKAAFDKLKSHMVVICEQPEGQKVKSTGIYDFNVDELDNYLVTGYSKGGSDEHAGVVIIGQKLLHSGQVLNLICPFSKFEDEDNYIFGGALSADIDACDHEVNEYLFNGKWGIVQQSFDFDTPEDAELKVSVSADGENFKEMDLKKLKKVS